MSLNLVAYAPREKFNPLQIGDLFMETETTNTTESANTEKPRDEKGKFAKKPKTITEKIAGFEDPNEVKIKVLNNPPPKKDFKVKIGDLKERAVQGFISSVATLNPMKIRIGNNTYYSDKALKVIDHYYRKRYNVFVDKCLKDDMEDARIVQNLITKTEGCVKMADEFVKKAKFWRRVAMLLSSIYLFAMGMLYYALRTIEVQ